MIQTLIDKQDSFEIVRDKIVDILKTETVNQQALAIAAAKDPNDWKLRIFSERSNPFEEFLREPVADTSPLINVAYDNSNFDKSSSDVKERQTSDTIYNIDCYGYGVSSDDGAGHKPGDQEAAFETQRAVRLVRNILMASNYTYLGMRGLVGTRWPQSINAFQPAINEVPVNHVIGVRIAFQVRFNEFSPQYVADVLELISIETFRAEDGEVLLLTDYDYS